MGRKRSMILVNIPFIAGWFLLYIGNDIFKIYSGFILLGVGLGVMETPVVLYIGGRTF